MKYFEKGKEERRWGVDKSSLVCSTHRVCRTGVYTHLNDIFEAESAVTGQAFAFASPTQILTMGPFRVNVAKFF